MKLLLVLLLALLLPLAASAQGPSESRKIELLIQSVEQLPSAVFIRNGSEHDSKDAGTHLRRKWKYAGKRIKTAQEFIRYCATESSLTHVKYRIRLADGTSVESAKWLTDRLRQIEARPAATAARAN